MNPRSEDLHLHAILGHSIIPLVNAILCDRFTAVTLYSDDENRTRKFIARVNKYIEKLKDNRLPINISIKPIPKISEYGENSDPVSMLDSLSSFLQKGKPIQTENNVLFFSGTAGHLLLFVEILEFKQFLSYEYESKEEDAYLILRNKDEETRIARGINFSTDDFLLLHGMTETELEELAPKYENEEKKIVNLVKNVELRGSKLFFDYDSKQDYAKGGNRRRFCTFVLRCDEIFGKFTTTHLIEDEMLNNWLQNTSLPFSFDLEEE